MALVAGAPAAALANGTPAGTVVDNAAIVTFEVGGASDTANSNLVSFKVLQRIDAALTLQSGQVTAAPGETGAALLFLLTNSGNGSDRFALSVDSALVGDDFDPLPAAPAIYFDTDSSGDPSIGDVAYAPGVNDPQLAADQSVAVLVVSDMPPGVADGSVGRIRLIATSLAGSGSPGSVLAGQGPGGIDAIAGASGGSAAATGEYRIADVALNVVKSVTVSDPFGGSEPTAGATLTYVVTVNVANAGTAGASVFSDPVPAFSTYLPGSITLNGVPLSDAADSDPGEFDTSAAPTVVVRLGDLTQADGVQRIEFRVTID